MNPLIQLVEQHPYLAIAGAICIWLFNNVVTALVTSLPAPTATSSIKYVYWFKVANTITGNIWRAKNTAVESSPNWIAAVEKHVATLGG